MSQKIEHFKNKCKICLSSETVNASRSLCGNHFNKYVKGSRLLPETKQVRESDVDVYMGCAYCHAPAQGITCCQDSCFELLFVYSGETYTDIDFNREFEIVRQTDEP